MNTSPNRNRWAVTDQALTEAAPTLKGKPIGMGKGYKIDAHYPAGETMNSGIFSSYEKTANYALGTAKIDDAKTWLMLKKGELKAVSVVIRTYRDLCSKCGVNLTSERYYDNHKCLAESDSAYLRIESFNFERVDFVDVPAYPQAGVLDLSAKNSGSTVSLQLCANFYENQNKKPKSVQETVLLTENENRKIADLEAANTKLSKDLEAAVAKATANETQVTALKASLDKIQKASHEALVNEVYEARAKAGIAGKIEDEKTLLTAQTNETLTLLKSDAAKVAAANSTVDNTPKTKYAKQSGDPLEGAIKEMRAKLGFAPRKEDK
jgi:hypothetical protein